MPTNRRAKSPLSLADETLGDQIHRAYIRGRREFKYNYETVAARIHPFMDCSGQALRYLEQKPLTTSSMRKRAFLALIAYGFEPNDFGLMDNEISMDSEVIKAARRRLNPRSSCLTAQQSGDPTQTSRETAGHSTGRSSANGRRRTQVA